MSEIETGVNMPKYKSHKTVHALKIIQVYPRDDNGGAALHFVDPTCAPIEVDHLFMAKHNPSAGGYYVVYDDGYTSWSPANAFEEGYTLIEDKPHHSQECGTTYRGCAPDCKFQQYYSEKESN
jgi:hypothetical protein